MIYLARLPRALLLLGMTLWLGSLGILVLAVNVVYAALTSATWREALTRIETGRERSRR